ncbi:hypothetical protein [Sphingomonas sp. LY160]|uniref:hypothetical protein n=1 Tax=Sphingomonas sp. LY160 TaxID=3095342 RepID=UPI002ADEBB88|nr:hypothetical protein [Sphingomonas sp. LY160]MEA1072684.1 hypothetical protein [Sphingomonas sp. LY160]
MRKLFVALAATVVVSTPALAQQRQQAPRAPSPLAQQAMQGGDQPDVLLDVPNLSVDELTIDVANLDVNIALDARLANLLKLTAGADVHVDQVKIGLKGVQAQATLIVRLDNVRAIIERTLATIEKNPQLVSGLLNSVNSTVGTVGNVANNAVGSVGGVASSLLSNGQVLDLARAGLTEVSRTVNSAGQTVRQVRNGSGGLLEVVTDSAGKIVSSRPVSR